MKFILLGCIGLSSAISALSAEAGLLQERQRDGFMESPTRLRVKGPHPAVIVIHDWWGLNDWVKEQASKLADQGYVRLAIDLYRGKVATTCCR